MSHKQLIAFIVLLSVFQISGVLILQDSLNNNSKSVTVDQASIDKLTAEIQQLRILSENVPRQTEKLASALPNASQFRADIRAILEEELANWYLAYTQQISDASYSCYSAQKDNNFTPTKVAMQAHSESQQIIRQAISNGSWTTYDLENISEHTANLTHEQRIQLLEEFHGALNSQLMTLEGPPPPL